MTNKQKRGLLILLAPFVLLIGTSILQVITRFIFASTGGGIGVGINIISMLVGVVAVIGIIPCLIIGVIYLATGSNTQPAQPSPTATGAPMPPSTNSVSTQTIDN